ncbi:MAG: hypothetical protein JNM85_03585 [Chthonomonas sp.]|nr:hypothetical protein [Chthonomonas sp.]
MRFRLLATTCAALALAGCGGSGGSGGGGITPDTATLQARTRYAELNGTFPTDTMALAIDSLSNQVATVDEIHGILLFCESNRYRVTRDPVAKERVAKAFNALVDRQNLDGDDGPGYGIGQAWDAFGDGSVNGVDHPYTVSTAVCLEGMLTARTSGALTPAEVQAADALIADAIRWIVKHTYLPFGYYAYSAAPGDMNPVTNVSSYTSGIILRALAEIPRAFTATEIKEFREKSLRAVEVILDERVMVDGAPHWNYHGPKGAFWTKFANQPNDLRHHGYTLWGLELARKYQREIRIPYTQAQAAASLRQYFRGDRLVGYPDAWPYPLSKSFDKPSQIWGAGYCIGVSTLLGDTALADEFVKQVSQVYPNWPTPQNFPAWYGKSDPTYYPRFGANILWGLTTRAYGPGF